MGLLKVCFLIYASVSAPKPSGVVCSELTDREMSNVIANAFDMKAEGKIVDVGWNGDKFIISVTRKSVDRSI